ncbi:major facilitator superfamily domain-containing protein [Venturia nashicola]|uniref:Major facilitator superfamily domain-containing protein n=1 Tax=Venturia nashicola TaxID=86259 RepID=A0A4Z1NUH2_9PEZI|nr:major facilitator superfamily domain-containing protein [Venturia nashicola]
MTKPTWSPPVRKHLAFIALSTTLFLAALDTVLIATALPTISAQFNITDAGYAWVGSIYLLTFAATVPAWGGTSEIFGRKPILLLANAIFFLGSLISALAKELPMLLAGRAVQGAGAGGIMTLVYVCVGDIYSERKSSFVLGLLGMFYALATALGPVLGGVFTQINWTICFWINLPTISVAVLLLWLFLDVHDPRTNLITGLKEIDVLGSVTVASATVMFLLGIQMAGVKLPWKSPTVILLIIFGILTFGLFLLLQWKISKKPIIPIRIFSNVSNASTLLVVAFDAMVFNSIAYFLPLYFQTTLNASPLKAGVWMLGFALPLAVISGLAGWFMEQSGRYLECLRGGLIIMTIGIGACISFPEYISLYRIIGFLVLIGIGLGPNFQGPMIALRLGLAPKDIGAGMTTLSFLRMLSGAIGVVIGQVIFQSQMKSHLPSLADAGVPSNMINELARGSAIASSKTALDTLPHNLLILIQQAKAQSFSKVWIAYTVLSFAGLVASLGIKKMAMSDTHEEVRTGLPGSQPESGSSSERTSMENGLREKRRAGAGEAV